MMQSTPDLPFPAGMLEHLRFTLDAHASCNAGSTLKSSRTFTSFNSIPSFEKTNWVVLLSLLWILHRDTPQVKTNQVGNICDEFFSDMSKVLYKARQNKYRTWVQKYRTWYNTTKMLICNGNMLLACVLHCHHHHHCNLIITHFTKLFTWSRRLALSGVFNVTPSPIKQSGTWY